MSDFQQEVAERIAGIAADKSLCENCLLYTSPSPRD